MTPRLETLRRRVQNGEYKSFRQDRVIDVTTEAESEGLTWMQAASRLTQRMCEAERVVIDPDERIVFTRTIPHPAYPMPKAIIAQAEAENAGIGHRVDNICADWGMAIRHGLQGRKEAVLVAKERFRNDPEALEFLDASSEAIDAVIGLAQRYADTARTLTRFDLAEVLEHSLATPRTFHEALQSLRLMQAAVWLSGHCHVGFGRFDQYMWPYLKGDLDAGRLSIPEAEELLAEFFISLNKDSDLHPGIQQGDNGQSLMLGGVTRDGEPAENLLTSMVLRVSCEVNMIDPKINLRIGKDTPIELLVEASKLTRKGLGFPQYSNDDVVIPALARHGYSLEDARDYTVAACWEFIIPGCAMDVPNINAVSFPAAADAAIRSGLSEGATFDGILERTRENIRGQVRMYVDDKRTMKYWPPAPYYSAVMTGCIEQGKDFNRGGARYYNYGIHGSGSSNAADALAAVKKLIFDEQSVNAAALLNALEDDFAETEPLRQILLSECPKVGNNDAAVDSTLVKLFDWFADACEEISDNGRGGIVRPGSGSAMYYVLLTKLRRTRHLEPIVGATADGRRGTDYICCSLAPSPGVSVRGPISVLQSFSKIDYSRICNGGPITMELSDTVFRNDEALEKVAMLVRAFAQLGCQQLQLNTLNPDILRDAQKHPENHRNLIVRVWGWSGYFCELEPEYQNHVISRHLYANA